MNYKMKGFICQIDPIKELDNGAKIVTYRINTEAEYNAIHQFEMYKKPEYAEHADNFLKFNKVGDLVDVEFKLKSKAWTNPTTNIEKTFTSLSAWRIDKVESIAQSTPAQVPTVDETPEELPF